MSEWGTRGDGPGELESPVSLATDAFGDAFIADARGNGTVVHKFDSQGHPLLSFFVEGCREPGGIAVDRGGAIYLVGQRPAALYIFFPDGTALRTLRRAAGRLLEAPEGVVVDDLGEIFVAEGGAHRVVELNPRGRLVKAWGATGNGASQVGLPVKVATGVDGSVYVADAQNRRIEKFTGVGEFAASWEFPFTAPPASKAADEGYGLAVSGKFVVASDEGQGLVQFWTPEGQPKFTGARLQSAASSPAVAPRDIALTSSGELLVLDAGVARVLRFRINF